MDIGADGLKTGFTKDAGYGLVGSAVQNGTRLIVVVNGAQARQGARQTRARGCSNGASSGFERASAVRRRRRSSATRQAFRRRRPAACRWSPRPASTSWCRENSTDRLSARIVYTGPVPAPVAQGQQIGTCKVWRGDNLVLEVPLKAAESVGAGNLARAPDAATEFVIGLVPRRIPETVSCV